MNVDVLTLFPEMIRQGMDHSILKRASEKGLYTLNVVNFRDYSTDRFGRVDDAPYGGGAGMVLQPQPLDAALQALALPQGARIVYGTPKGTPFSQKKAEELAGCGHLVFICGHYEGVDQRLIDKWVTDEISLGDYVLTGGELPTLVMLDAILRLLPGVLGGEGSAEDDSFSNGLLEYPHYTRPPVFEGREVPEMLLSGHHANIAKWRLAESLLLTARRRPELYRLWCSDPARTKADRKVIQSVEDALKALSDTE